MRRHAKASSAATTQRQACGLGGGPVDGALATRASSSRGNGSGAPSRRHLRLGSLSLSLAVVALLSVLTTGATAAITHNTEPFSPLTGTGSGLTLQEPQGVAVDEATGNVFVSDEDRVAILGAEGGAPVGLAAPYEIPDVFFGSNFQAGLAYDNSATSPARGTLYAFDRATESVRKFVRNPVSERYEAAAGDIPVSQAFLVALSVDREGNLYVGMSRGGALSALLLKYDPFGNLLDEYEFSGASSAPITTSSQVAVDSGGDVFLSDEQKGVFEFPANGSGEIDPSVYTHIATGAASGLAIDSTTDHLYAALSDHVAEYDAASGKVVSEFGAESIKYTGRIAVNSTTHRIYVADTGAQGDAVVNVFGPAVVVPTTATGAASNVAGTKATLNGTVDPEELAVEDCFFEFGETTNYGQTASCEGLIPTDSETHPVSADITGLAPNGVVYHYRLVTENENGIEKGSDRTFATASTATTEPATAITPTSAILHGTVRPEGAALSDCSFEYGLVTSAGFEDSASCDPSAAEIAPDFSAQAVSAAVTGLQPNSTYRFRISTTNPDGTLKGQTLTFTTSGPPQISEIRARDADGSSVTLEAKINPSGFGTSYHFEWGPGIDYGHRIPADFEPFIGSGHDPVLVTAKVSGLAAGSTYHYRVVASSTAGTAASADQVMETLNSCGLPEQRCFELVSPRDAGPVAAPGSPESQGELQFQAATEPGALAYVIESGLPNSTKGAEVLYLGRRISSGWSSSQLTPPLIVRNETPGETSTSAKTLGLSEDLSCGVVESNQPLTADAGTRLVVEAGGGNLFRRNPDGSYTAITKLPPTNLDAVKGAVGQEYSLQGFSEDCGKVVFENEFEYPGVTGSKLYEWDEGALRSVGFVPGPGGETAVPATAGTAENHANVVSDDGSRVFFSAERQQSDNPAEVGQTGIFVRENGNSTRDLSMSETAIPSSGATYQWATPDGARIFFTANAGLTDESSGEGQDLYEYDLEKAPDEEPLTDLSVTQETGGAGVAGMIGASRDGSRVYFAARGQLSPGRGDTFAENQSAGTYSVYEASGGEVSYVATIRNRDLDPALMARQELKTSRVSPDGRYLLLEAHGDVTGYQSGGPAEAYLYDAEATSEATLCVSCRQDGKPSATPSGNTPLLVRPNTSPLSGISFLAVDGNEPRVFFNSFDRLATDGVEGLGNLYEWSHGQVFHISTEPSGISGPVKEELGSEGQPVRFAEENIKFVGASADGSDLYFATARSLSWEDGDQRSSVYDARIGGGFAQPPAPPGPCDANVEGSCSGSSPQPPAVPGAASTTFSGPGNVKAKQTKHHKKKHHKKKKKKKNQQKKKQARHDNGNRRAGK